MNKIWNALFNTLHQSMIILSEWHYCDGSWFCINIGNKWKWLNVSKSWGDERAELPENLDMINSGT